MSVLSVGQPGSVDVSAMASSADNAIGVSVLRKALDASTASVAPLLASLPNSNRTLGGALDVRM